MDPIWKARLIAVGILAFGLSGWLLPERFQVLRFKRFVRKLLPDAVNRAVPKVLGTALIGVGVVMLVLPPRMTVPPGPEGRASSAGGNASPAPPTPDVVLPARQAAPAIDTGPMGSLQGAPSTPTARVANPEAAAAAAVEPFVFAPEHACELGANGTIEQRERGRTPLHRAAAGGDLRRVEALLAAGADPNAQQADGTSPLHEAIDREHPRIVERLLAAGADSNLAACDITPLVMATWVGSVDMVRALLTAGAGVEAVQGQDEERALMFAVADGQREIIDLLLAAGAERNARDRLGWTALDKVAECPFKDELRARGFVAGKFRY